MSSGDDSEPVDSDESAEEAAPARKKQKKSGASMFIEEEADVDDDDEEEDDDDDDEMLSTEAREAEALENQMAARERMRQQHNQFDQERDPGEDVEGLVAGIEQRHQRGKQRQRLSAQIAEGGEQAPTHVSRQARLPEVKDPKLFMIKVKTGKEREVTLSLMRKAQAMEDKGKPLGIYSVVWPGTKGFVYVESLHESSAREAIKGMRLMIPWSLKWVPVNEMTAVLNIVAQKKPIAEKQWVRIKRGLYKGDLGRVELVMDSGAKALVKIMPRLDLEALREKMSNDGTNQEKKSGRPPQGFFSAKEIKPLITGSRGSIQYEKRRHAVTGLMMHHFNKEMYHRGYLHKEFNVMTMINYTDVQPTLEELQQFRDRGQVDDEDEEDEERESDIADALQFASKKDDSFGFAKGDTVRVLEGELTNLTAKVLSVNNATKMVKVKPDHKIINTKEIEFPIGQLMKYIKVGDHVKVINGQYSGETGVVVNVETGEDQWEAIVLTDSSAKEISAFVRDLRESSEVQQDMGSLGGYELQDLVMLGQTTVGVIVRVGREDFQVLVQKGTVQTCQLQELRGKRNSQSQRAVALDSASNHIQCGDVVVVSSGSHKGHEGTIKRIHRAFLFLHSHKKLENNGMFVVKARNVVIAGSKSRGGASRFGGAFMKAAQSMGAKGGKGKSRGLEDELCGKTVKLRKGLYKGYIGVVRSATDSTAKVEIHSKNKIIKIDKKDLVAVGDRNGEIQDASNVQAFDNEALTRTPMVGMQTPINVMATPMIGQSTPMHTPLHDGSATPAAEDAWDPSVSFTPQRVENIKNEDDQSSYAGSSIGGPGGYSTPSMNSYQPSTPTSLAVQSPAPEGALPHTPAASYDFNGPTTPNAPSTIAPTTPMSDAISTNAPHTPQSSGVIRDSSSNWFKNGMEVIVHGRRGLVKSVEDGECQIVFDDTNMAESALVADVHHVQPDKNDKVIVTSGDNEVARGSTGTLIGVDDADGIVKMDSDLEIKILPMAMLAKLR